MEQVGWMYVLDIDGKTEDEVLKNMKPNTRNTIRKTLKNGIEIIELEKKDLPMFHKIMIGRSSRSEGSPYRAGTAPPYTGDRRPPAVGPGDQSKA